MSIAPLQHLLGVVCLLVIACGPLPLCGALLAPGHARRGAGRTLLAVLTLWCVLQADLALLAGLAHRFDRLTIIAGELLLAAIGLAAARRRSDWRQLIAGMGTAAASIPTAGRIVAVALGLVAVSLLWHVTAVPVVDWDSWAFHMPAMARWLQHGSFVRIEQYAARPRSRYPFTWEAVCALFLIPFGEDTCVTLPSLVAWAVLGLATWAAARDLSASRALAVVAAALTLSVPHLQGQVNSLHVDVPFAAFAGVALSFALSFRRRGQRDDLALMLAALGMLAGLRATAPAYAAVIGALLVVPRRWRNAEPVSPPAGAGRALAVICVASALFVGGFWWVKNLAEHGNPLGNVALTQRKPGAGGGASSLPAVTATALAFAFDPWSTASWQMVAARLAGEAGLPLLIMLAQLVFWPAALRAARRPEVRQGLLLAALWAIMSVALFIFTPTSAVSGIQIRLGFSALAALAIAGAVSATHARVPEAVWALLAIVAVVATSGYSRVFQLGAVMLIPIALLRRWLTPRLGVAASACVAAAALVLFTFAARERRARMRVEYYGSAFAYLEQHVGEDEPVAYFLSDRSYHFYGTSLRRPVRYMPPPPEGPTRAWFDELRAAGIRAVIVGSYDDSDAARAVVNALVPPAGELVPVFGKGRADEVSVYRVPSAARPQGGP